MEHINIFYYQYWGGDRNALGGLGALLSEQGNYQPVAFHFQIPKGGKNGLEGRLQEENGIEG
jgi:hypothetical protein